MQLLIIRFGHVQFGIAGFQLPLDTAEQVQFPEHIQAQVVTFTAHALLGHAGLLGLTKFTTGAAGDGRQLVVAEVITNSLGRPQAGKGHAQLAVILERLLAPDG